MGGGGVYSYITWVEGVQQRGFVIWFEIVLKHVGNGLDIAWKFV